MSKPQRNQFNTFLVVFILTMLFLMAARTPLDSDLWWHLSAGRETWQNGWPMLEDHFSYTRLGEKWINHSWLSEVIMFLAYKVGGYLGLGLVFTLLAVFSMGLLLRQMRSPMLFNMFVLVLGATVASVVWSPRPQVFSLLLLTISGGLLSEIRRGNIRMLWYFPIIFIVWSNLHGGYPLGLFLIGVVFLGEACNRILGIQPSILKSWKEIVWFIGSGALSWLAVVVNPNGFDMLRIPFQTVGVQALQQLISEWASPDFHQLIQQPMLWLLFAIVVAFSLADRPVDMVDVLSLCFFAYLGLVSRRNYGPFAIIATPILANYAWRAIQNIKTKVSFWPARERADHLSHDPASRTRKVVLFKTMVNLILIFFAFFAGIAKLYITSQNQFVDAIIRKDYPVNAVTWLMENKPDGRLFSEYRWGGYLTWKLIDYPVFVDGRTDLFGDEIINQWLSIIQGDAQWANLINQWGINLVMIEPTRPLVQKLVNAGWNLVYQDDSVVLFQR